MINCCRFLQWLGVFSGMLHLSFDNSPWVLQLNCFTFVLHFCQIPQSTALHQNNENAWGLKSINKKIAFL